MRLLLIAVALLSLIGLCIAPASAQAVGEKFKDCDKCPEMVVVPAGDYMMGEDLRSESDAPYSSIYPAHKVTIAKPFAVGRFAVTFAEWDACLAERGCNNRRPKDEGWGRGRQPVMNITLDQGKSYIAWLGRKTGKPYRLPSESEREYFARAGTSTVYWWGNDITPKQANYNSYYQLGNANQNREKTVPVDMFDPNPWGLYQVHGNLFEMTQDCWHWSYKGAPTDGSPWTTTCEKPYSDAKEAGYVVRGGGFRRSPSEIGSKARESFLIKDSVFDLGLRVVRALAP